MALVNGNTHSALSTASPAGSDRQDGLFLERATNDLVVVSAGLPMRRLFGPCEHVDFLGATDIPSTGDTVVNSMSPWFVKDTSSAGAPVKVISGDADNGALNLKFASNDEAEVLTLGWNDEQNLDPAAGPVVIFRLALEAQLLATDILVFGLASAQNDTANSVASNAWFRLEGANLNIFVESDDGTTDNDDDDVGVDYVAGTYYEYAVDATDYEDVRFFIRTSLDGKWTDVTPSSATYKLNSTTGLQPFVQIQKSGGAGETSLLIDYATAHCQRKA